MKLPHLAFACCAASSLLACSQPGDSTATDDQAQGAAATSVTCPAANEDGVIEIQPGLSAKVLSNGYGRTAAMGDDAGVHAVLWLYDESKPEHKGLEIWSSGGEEPFEFQIGSSGFIDGWSPGIECMHLGETRELIIAPELAYGERGRPPVPGNATLLYELELVTLQGADDDREAGSE